MTDETRAEAVKALRRSSMSTLPVALLSKPYKTMANEDWSVICKIARDARAYAEEINEHADYWRTCLIAADLLEQKAWP